MTVNELYDELAKLIAQGKGECEVTMEAGMAPDGEPFIAFIDHLAVWPGEVVEETGEVLHPGTVHLCSQEGY